MTGALDGIRVIDAGVLVQAPQAAALLAQFGAEVIKIEFPGFGDHSRWLPVTIGDARSAYFAGNNRGKRSITVNLNAPAGRAVFLSLVERADVLLTNFSPGRLEAWGLGPDVLAACNPRLIHGAGSAYGSLGPDAHLPGADLGGQAVAFRERPTRAWCSVLDSIGLRCAPVQGYAEVAADPQVWANGYLAETDEGPVVGVPVRFSATPAVVGGPPPELGQHTEEVLLEHGYTWDDIAALRDEGAI